MDREYENEALLEKCYVITTALVFTSEFSQIESCQFVGLVHSKQYARGSTTLHFK